MTQWLFFRRAITSNAVFFTIAAVFILTLGVFAVLRQGKDLKVGLFGVQQVLDRRSPYENPTDTGRPLFRYAPGFAIMQYPFLLKSKMVAPFEFENITPSVLAWYAAGVISLFLSCMILLRLVPAVSHEAGLSNLKLSILMSLPLIGYELANGQNKLLALFFMCVALFLFEKKKTFLSSLSFCLALTIYIPLAVFVFYFILKSRGRYLAGFVVSAFLVFILLPSFVFGFEFNAYLLKSWFDRCLKPFFMTVSLTSYLDLRRSSQSLPSALSRLFVSGHTGDFKYLINPLSLHSAIRFFSGSILLFSCIAAARNARARYAGLASIVFLILALILPQYCIYYTWAWLFVVYFAVFNHMSFPDLPEREKKVLGPAVAVLFITSWLIGFDVLSYLSILFWGTLLMWLALTAVLVFGPSREA